MTWGQKVPDSQYSNEEDSLHLYKIIKASRLTVTRTLFRKESNRVAGLKNSCIVDLEVDVFRNASLDLDSRCSLDS